MTRFPILAASLIFLIGSHLPANSNAEESARRLFFLHHSTGRYMLDEGNARQHLDQVNGTKGTDMVLWDHDYNYIGLSDIEGDLLGYHYSIPDDDTYPAGLHTLWTTSNAARDSILVRYDVIAFKSCYPACDIASDAQLEQYKQWYREMRDFFDTRPDKIFMILSPPPRHRLSTNSEHAGRARDFANWMTGSEYLDGHPNLVSFDFFDLLAHPDDGSATANMLRYDFELYHNNGDSHPNVLANQTVAPLFVEALAEAASPSSSAVGPVPLILLGHGSHPNPFNPTAVISFELGQEEAVRLDVLDSRGKLVRHLFSGVMSAGLHEHIWDGRDNQGRAVGSGLYLYRIRSADEHGGGKMLLVR